MRGTQNNYVALKSVWARLLFPGHDVHWDEPIDVRGRAYADTVKCNYCARHAWRQTDMLFVWAAGETEPGWFPPASIVLRDREKKTFWILKKKGEKIGFLFLKQLAVISGKINPSTHGKRQKTNEYDNDFLLFWHSSRYSLQNQVVRR